MLCVLLISAVPCDSLLLVLIVQTAVCAVTCYNDVVAGRSRWVYYSNERFGWDYDGTQVPPDW